MTGKARQPCPDVLCGSSDAFSWNTGGYGKCHACDRAYPSKDETFEWAQEAYPTKYAETVVEIRKPDPSNGHSVPMRGITKETMQDFKVHDTPC